MKSRCQTAIIVLVTLVIGFALGRGHAVLTRGYFYEIRDKKTFESPNGMLEWRYVTKTVGLPFLNPGTTELEYKGRLVYSAERIFQEDFPFARDVVFDGRTVSWNDGELSYFLKIEEAKRENEPKMAVEPTPVAVTPPADAGGAPSTSVAHLER